MGTHSLLCVPSFNYSAFILVKSFSSLLQSVRYATASVSSEVSYWIGGRYEGSHEPASWKWINGQRIKDATWKDIDAVAGAVADLAAGATRRRCLVAEVEENAGEWSHADCGDVKPFLCQTRC